MGQVNLFTIDDSAAREILRDPRFAHLGCVSSHRGAITSAKAKCGRCKKKIQTATNNALQAFTNCLTRLPTAQRNELKQLLNARQLRAVRVNAKGQRVQITF
jgi:hypothetical protein